MSDSIVVAVLALAGTLAGAYLANRRSTALIAYRLEALEKRVQAHNHLVERTYRLEERTELQGEKLNTANYRIKAQEQTKKGEM